MAAKRKIIFILTTVFLYGGSFLLCGAQNITVATNVQTPIVQQQEVLVSEVTADEGKKPVENTEEEDMAGLKDPFISCLPTKAIEIATDQASQETSSEDKLDTSSFVVTGIVWGALAPKAIISGEVYGVGDVLKEKEAKITKIDKEGILLEYKAKEYLLKRSALTNLKEGP